MVAVLVFVLLIIIHELGHFLAAKATGVKVNEFSVGFGPKLIKKQIGETLYSINLIPLGGACVMEGESEDSANDRAFCNKGPFKRFVIVVAGAVFNLILGLIIVALSLSFSEVFTSKQIAKFEDNAVSQQSGLEVGDEILEVDGRKVFSTYDLSYAFTGVDDESVDLVVRRNGKKEQLNDVKFASKEIDGTTFLTVDFWVKGEEKTFSNYVRYTVNTSISYGRVVWFSLVDLIGGKFGLNAVSGPVGVTQAIGSVAKTGLENLLPIMALITINLGIFNLLPIPALDGGRLLFILFEIIFRKPVPQKYETLVHGIGFALLIGFMLLVTAKDIIALFIR